jgi:hypothetical protein
MDLKSTPDSFVALNLPDYEPAFAMAIEQFWQDRAGQMARQRLKGLTDAGTRGSVIGGLLIRCLRQDSERTCSGGVEFSVFAPGCANQIRNRHQPAAAEFDHLDEVRPHRCTSRRSAGRIRLSRTTLHGQDHTLPIEAPKPMHARRLSLWQSESRNFRGIR